MKSFSWPSPFNFSFCHYRKFPEINSAAISYRELAWRRPVLFRHLYAASLFCQKPFWDMLTFCNILQIRTNIIISGSPCTIYTYSNTHATVNLKSCCEWEEIERWSCVPFLIKKFSPERIWYFFYVWYHISYEIPYLYFLYSIFVGCRKPP